MMNKLLDVNIVISFCLLASLAATKLINAENDEKHESSTVQWSSDESGSAPANQFLHALLSSPELKTGLEKLARTLFVPKSELDSSSDEAPVKTKTKKKTTKTSTEEFPIKSCSSRCTTDSKPKEALADCLTAHNKYRRLHGVPELTWDDKVASFSQQRSDHIAASDGAEFRHPDNLPYGENLFWNSDPNTDCDTMVSGWYNEIDLYDFNSPNFSHGTGHFTQLVWRATTKLGCGLATSAGKRGGVYLTCNYDPAGNMIGSFKENVPPKSKSGGSH